MAEKIFLVSYGEYGDLYVASLASSLKEIRPGAIVKCVGVGVPTHPSDEYRAHGRKGRTRKRA